MYDYTMKLGDPSVRSERKISLIHASVLSSADPYAVAKCKAIFFPTVNIFQNDLPAAFLTFRALILCIRLRLSFSFWGGAGAGGAGGRGGRVRTSASYSSSYSSRRFFLPLPSARANSALLCLIPENDTNNIAAQPDTSKATIIQYHIISSPLKINTTIFL